MILTENFRDHDGRHSEAQHCDSSLRLGAPAGQASEPESDPTRGGDDHAMMIVTPDRHHDSWIGGPRARHLLTGRLGRESTVTPVPTSGRIIIVLRSGAPGTVRKLA